MGIFKSIVSFLKGKNKKEETSKDYLEEPIHEIEPKLEPEPETEFEPEPEPETESEPEHEPDPKPELEPEFEIYEDQLKDTNTESESLDTDNILDKGLEKTKIHFFLN